MREVAVTVGVATSPDSLGSKFSTTTRRSIISITATDGDRQLAAALANAAADVLMSEFQRIQLSQIAEARDTLLQFGVGDDTSLINAQAAALTSLSLLEPGIAPSGVSRRPFERNATLGGLMGLIAGAVLVVLLEIFSNKIRTSDELRRFSGVPLLGAISLQQNKHLSLIRAGEDQGQLIESYRFLRAYLESSAVTAPGCPAYLVTSALEGEGKTTTAVNLCLSAAKDGKRVILIDADLRSPSVHTTLGIANAVGLANLLQNTASADEAVASSGEDNLRVVTSGPLPPDAAQVLHAGRFSQILAELRQSADLLVVDSPSALSVVDPLLIAPVVDGVILIVEADKTPRPAVRRLLRLFEFAPPGSLFTVFNKLRGE
jgi:capsular exopolysaccharide synthesis family protein